MPIAALIPLALQLLPQLARWIGGDTVGQVAQTVAGVVQSVTGADTPEAAAAAIADPAKRGELLLKLAEIHAAQEAAARAAELEALKATLADVAGARSQTVELARAGSPIAYGAVVVSAIILLAYAVMLFLVLTRAIPAGAERTADQMLGYLCAMAMMVPGYWLGSSASSARKDGHLAEARQALAQSVPVAALGPPPEGSDRPFAAGAR